MSVKRTACTLTGAEADAAACFSHGRRFSLLPPQRQGLFRARARERISDGDNFAPRRELLLSAVTKVAKSTGRNCVSALPQRAMPVRCRPRFPSRNRCFPDRCRSPDCASTAFRCRCLLLRQKLFVLPCRRLRNNYILCPTGTPTFAAARRQRRDLIIANASSAPDPTLAQRQRQRRKGYKQSPEPTMLPTALHARVHTAKSA